MGAGQLDPDATSNHNLSFPKKTMVLGLNMRLDV